MPQLDDHIAPTKKQNSDLSSDLADFVNVNESLESEEAEDVNVIELTSDSEKESVENRNSDSESETGDALFKQAMLCSSLVSQIRDIERFLIFYERRIANLFLIWAVTT